ncbi:MAG TPA: sensor histidine kinase N-terminal domain-containing protein, partial [Rhodanobacteraceae bacterium]
MLVTLQLALAWGGYAYAARHLDRLLDGDLRTQAHALLDMTRMDPATGGSPRKAPLVLESAADARIGTGFQYWGSDNALVASSPNMRSVPLDAVPAGFADFSIDGKKWRALTELDDGRWI